MRMLTRRARQSPSSQGSPHAQIWGAGGVFARKAREAEAAREWAQYARAVLAWKQHEAAAPTALVRATPHRVVRRSPVAERKPGLPEPLRLRLKGDGSREHLALSVPAYKGSQ